MKLVKSVFTLYTVRRMIECTITGAKGYLIDLTQGGLEVHCFLLFEASDREAQETMEEIASYSCSLAWYVL